MLEDPIMRRKMAEQARKSVDGRGADRAAAALLDFAEMKTGPNPVIGTNA